MVSILKIAFSLYFHTVTNCVEIIIKFFLERFQGIWVSGGEAELKSGIHEY